MKLTRVLSALVALIAIAGPVSARTLREETMACRFIGDIENYTNTRGAGDRVAYTRFYQDKVPTKACMEFPQGAEFEIDKLSKWSGQRLYGCARFKGEYECFWADHYNLMTEKEWRAAMGL